MISSNAELLKSLKQIPTQLELAKIDSTFKKVAKHPRYKSDWASDVVVLDITHKDSDVLKDKKYYLNEYLLPSNAPYGAIKEPVHLTEFPHLVSLIKLSLNDELHNITGSNHQLRLSNCLNSLRIFFAWCIQNCVYDLSVLERDDYDEYASRLFSGGMYGVLNCQVVSADLIIKAETDRTIAERLVTYHRKNLPSINPDLLHAMTGLPFSKRNIPFSILEGMLLILGDESKIRFINRKEDVYKKYSQATIRKSLKPINRLYKFPESIRKPKCKPYPSINKYLSGNKNIENRTPNLSIDESVKILSACMCFVYDYAPIIINAMNYARGLFADEKHTREREKTLDKIENYYSKLASKSDLPFKYISGFAQRRAKHKNKSEPVLYELVKALQMSCMVTVAINHGRRKNEILGEGDLPYGLYRNCCRVVDGAIEGYEIDIYIEKTVQGWCTLPCNKLVFDSVSVLEKLNESFYVSGTDFSCFGGFAEKSGRQNSLFVVKGIVTSFQHNDARWHSLLAKPKNNLLWKIAGVDNSFLTSKTHIYRRLFSLLFMYRYDYPRLYDLKHHLRHYSLDMTHTYVTDPAMREDAESINELYKKENSVAFGHHKAASEQYIADKVKDILSEIPTAGGFTKTVHKIFRHFLRDVVFANEDISVQAERISEDLKDKGYSSLNGARMHGSCFITDALDSTKAHCYSTENKSANTATAKLNVCMHCPYHFDSVNHLDNLSKDLEMFQEKSEDHRQILAVREYYRVKCKELRAVIKLERMEQVENASSINWYKTSAAVSLALNSTLESDINQCSGNVRDHVKLCPPLVKDAKRGM